MRSTAIGAALVALSSLSLYGQAVPDRPAFEVASIKVTRSPGTVPVCLLVRCSGEQLRVNGSRVEIRFVSLYQLIVRAYRIKLYQLSGPNWMTSQKFDLVAKMPDGASKDQIPEMLQALLVERFHMSIRHENKEHPVYALLADKNGSKLKLSSEKASSVAEVSGQEIAYTPYGDAYMRQDGVLQIREGPYGPVQIHRGPEATTRVEFLRITMPRLAEVLTPSVDRVVVDATGLKGEYPVEVTWSVPPPPPPSPEANGNSPSPAPPPSLDFQSIEKAGLKLEKRTAPVDVIVVDSLEKMPTSN